MIDMEKNIRELLKDTIFAHPDDIKKATMLGKAKTTKNKKEKNGKSN
jgi:hypothetical protein